MTPIYKNVLRACMLSSIFTLAACGGSDDDLYDFDNSPNISPSPTVDPDPTPTAEPATLAEVQSQVFAVSCASSSCHGNNNQAPFLDSTTSSFNALVNVASNGSAGSTLVVPGDADASYLVMKLEGASTIAGSQMPIGGSLSDNQLALVRSWIEAGAEADSSAQPVETVTLTEVQSRIFSVSCAGSSCHDSDSPILGLDLSSESSSFTSLVNVAATLNGSLSLVSPGNPDDSFLVQKMEGDAGNIMPPGGILSNELLTLLRNWISGGALQSASVASTPRIVKTSVEDELDTIEYRLQVSALIDESTVSDGVVMLYIVEGDSRYLANQNDVNVEVSGAELVITYTNVNDSFDAIELEFNNPDLAAMLDVYGVTIEGETFQYPSVTF